MNFEQFGETFDATSDMWVVLNYLRLYALGLRLGKQVPQYPDPKRMRFKGDYPYGLVQKWAGVCLSLMKDPRADAVLENASVSLNLSNRYTINSLALPVLKIRYKLADYEKIDERASKYKKLLEKSCESEHFAAYIAEKKIFELDDDKFDIWETAMMLPLNYA